MPALDGIEIREVREVTCPDHGVIGVRSGSQAARALQRHHFEWRHQPNPENRVCRWRYPLASGRYRYCVLDAGHLDWMHLDEDGLGFPDAAALPRDPTELEEGTT